MVIIGLTGGIGSGKSTVAKMLAERGARVIDADRIGHEVYLPGKQGFDEVVAEFGAGVVGADGAIDRAVLGQRVFDDPDARRRLNAIVHPLIGAEIQARLAAAHATGARTPVVIEAALLLDTGARTLVNVVWVVVAPRETVIERIGEARGLGRREIEARMASQMSDEERRRLADVIIDNGGSLADLRRAVDAAWAETARG